MKWIEIIEIRTMSSDRKLLESQLHTIIKGAKQGSELMAIKIYTNLAVETDLSIHLFHDTQKAGVSGSPLGLRLVSVIKEFGLVSHSTWISAQLD